MACKSCGIPYQKSSLISVSNKHMCADCLSIERLINQFTPTSHLLYVADLYKKFLGICPIFDGENVIAANPSKIDLSGYDENAVIKELTSSLGLIDTQYNDSAEITTVCNSLMGPLLDKVKDLISSNPKGYLLSIINTLEYNLHITMSAVSWLNHGERAFNIEDITDNFGRTVVQSLNLQKNLDINFSSIYKEWENVLAFDKQAFQYGIELINYYSKKVPQSNDPIDQNKFGRLISTIRAIYHILHMRDTACDGILSDKKLLIDVEGSLRVNQRIDHDSFSDSYVGTLVNRRTSVIDASISAQFNTVCQTYLGVDFDDLPKLANLVTTSYTNSNEYLIGSISFFRLLIMDLLSTSEGNAEKLISAFLNDRDTINFAFSTADREFRLFRRCLIVIKKDIIACPVSLFSHAAIALYLNIIDNSLPDSPFKRELFEITSQIHEQFETDIAHLLGQSFKGAIIKNDIKKENEIPLISGKGYVVLSGQIDVLALIQGKLYVIECKDNPFKFNAKAVGNELNKFRKVNKGSYQNKLKNKIQDVVNNWDSVMNYLGVLDPNAVAKHEPQGLFVIDTFSAAQLESDLPYPVITFSDLTRFIQESIN